MAFKIGPRPWRRLCFAGTAVLAVSIGTSAQEAGTPAPVAPAPASSSAGQGSVQETARVPEMLTVDVLSEYPHDPMAYTQGLLLEGDVFIESTGHYGRSELREVDVASGEVLRSQSLPPSHFGEGVALVDDRLIQLTWKEGVAHVWDRQSFERIGQIRYSGEGWGLVYDGSRLIMSNGSSRLQFRDPDTFELEGEIEVLLGGQPLDRINELTYANGLVWANVWLQDTIVGIDPQSGHVRSLVDARPLRERLERRAGAPPPEVLNGIAYNGVEGTFYLTGKYWPTMFEVQFVSSR